MSALEKINMLMDSASVGVAGIAECAIDNAGFAGNVLHHLGSADHQEILRHAAEIVDGGMLSYATQADYHAASAILAAQ